MPPKPVSQNEADAEFYNIDFSYQTQLRLAAGQSPAQIQSKLLFKFKLNLRLDCFLNTLSKLSNSLPGQT